jgi:integrase
LLKGQRLNECAKLSWPEVHGDHIIVPASRMKGKEGKAREHLVPLTTTVRTLRALARRNGEDHRAVELALWVNHDLRRVRSQRFVGASRPAQCLRSNPCT